MRPSRLWFIRRNDSFYQLNLYCTIRIAPLDRLCAGAQLKIVTFVPEAEIRLIGSSMRQTIRIRHAMAVPMPNEARSAACARSLTPAVLEKRNGVARFSNRHSAGTPTVA